MNEKKYEKRYEFQKRLIAKQSKEIECLKLQINDLKKECEEKDEIINSIESLRNELINDIAEAKKYKEKYKKLVDELRKMKNTINQIVYKNKWSLIKFLIK